MKNKVNKKRFRFLVFYFVIITTLICLCFPGLFKNLKFGLDLQGGFEVLYKVESIDGKEVTSDMVTNTYKTMLKRIDGLGVSEPVITVEGEDKIRVQLAGVTDVEQARTILSKAANLTFRDTKDNLLMNSDVLVSGGAKVGQDQKGLPAVSLSISNKDEFYKITKAISESSDNRIVIWLDFDPESDSFEKEQAKCGSLSSSRCLSVAGVSQGFSSDVIIQGNFTKEEVTSLVELINSGSLPTKLTEMSSKTVDASFGANTLEKTFIACLVGVALIILFMIAMYRFAGFVASIGIIIYTFLTFFIFWLIGGVLSLPGIAAMLIGIGMAVDANVINFTRIRDEYKIRKDFKLSYKNGNTASIGTILDSNITTLLVAIILFILGESSVKGFATMLIISIVTTLFVMVFLVRKMLNKFVETNYFEDKQNLFIGLKNKEIKGKFVKNGRIIIMVPIVIFIAGIISLTTNKLNLGVEFKGGTSITIKSNDVINVENIKTDLENLNYNIIAIDEIDEKTIDVSISDSLNEEQIIKKENHLNETYNASTDIGVISNVVKQELIKNAILSVIIAMITIIIYISIRYQFSYAISGIIALIHDLFMMITVFSLFNLEVSPMFIAALLSIIGYSINNTIVTFDKIKENLKDKNIKKKEDLQIVVNESIQNIFSRSIITTLTTLIPVVALIFLGTYEILNFNIALLVGLIAGAYSSLFIAPLIWYSITKKSIGKPKKKKWYEIDEVEEKRIKGVNS